VHVCGDAVGRYAIRELSPDRDPTRGDNRRPHKSARDRKNIISPSAIAPIYGHFESHILAVYSSLLHVSPTTASLFACRTESA